MKLRRHEQYLTSFINHESNVAKCFILLLFICVFDTKVESVDSFISKLNSRFTSVNFTYEIENNGQPPFLDVLVIKNNQNNLEFDIYRKDTSTLRYIPNDSHHCYQHKMASLNFLVHRLLSFPLSKERFEKERKLIKDI
ncbi:hypothetical protein NQ317_004004 [Molorchus minor]|uniref:Uncharacterized protein n=1 Tax=Molorchus minor TaxID=1323400 RepID=A0ABQ9JHU7_9CUCU|nr:hypothetical protein NQ317_004004 [Molorchus minor]